MTVGELIKQLNKFDPQERVMILDGFNGGGYPRTINIGPWERFLTEEDLEESGDCEGLEIASSVVILGYGCY